MEKIILKSVRQSHDPIAERPHPEWLRGYCPQCGDDLIANCYYGGRRYIVVWQCWSSFGNNPTCKYQNVP